MIKRNNFTERLLILALILLRTLSVNSQNLENIARKQNFDLNWRFALGDFVAAQTDDFNDKNWRVLDLPHDWSIEGKVDSLNPSGNDGGYFPTGIGWYRKNFEVPLAWKEKKVSIYFEGVYMHAEVFINSKSLGMHPYGYTSFMYDLTPYLNFGKENFIALRVDNSQQKNCRWYSGSGIYRHVWLLVTSPVHIEYRGTAITTSEVSNEEASLRLNTVVKNETNLLQNILLTTYIQNNKDKNVGYNEVNIELKPNSQKEVAQNIIIKEPLLWSPETPTLYTAKSMIRQNETLTDEANTSFGIRSLRFSVEKGFELNGKTIKLNGGCVHHDNGCLGAAAYDRAEERKVELLKAAGFNAVRTSHNPPSEAFLDACDRLGLLVIDEAFDGWKVGKNKYDYAVYFDKWWQRDLKSMVLRDRNHPSVVMWSIGNEIIERKNPEAVETAKMLVNCVHQIDGSRPITSAMTTWDKEWEIFDPLMAVHDVCGYNYQIHKAESDHARVPSRIILQTESYPKDAFSNWNTVQKQNYIIGDFVWTALDYIGESGIGAYYYPHEQADEHWRSNRYPWHGAYCGDIDLTGWKKPISHYRNLLWNGSEKLYMAVREPNPENGLIKTTMWAVWPTWESWTWPDHEGKDIQVEVYSKYPKVNLYLNNSLIGTLPTKKEQEYKATFTLPYVPGELKAVGMAGDEEMESIILKTAGKAAQIKLITDRTELEANGQDLSYITVLITDEEGNILPNAENKLLINIKGAGVIAGVESANLKDTESYTGERFTTWKGRALVVVKSTHKSGKIELTVSSPGLPDAVQLIKTVSN